MTFDLGKAMAKKGEFESARLAEFGFRQRARTFRMMAGELGAEPADLVAMVAQMDDEAILQELRIRFLAQADRIEAAYGRCVAEARAQLIRERGDPTPHRLA
ncbi:hypothetical protein GCM10023264_25140 [Sphingomonas daechungensis]|uniref:Uncharacterized protein n=1 Tax=Sphingomonas daechungensis TaxID=1176646 RepID=A0ABX6T1T5_9SPHN|nr:hypothetical protein [Sphingomonas daechungensis]QNP43509.1 hypothetical protein H9L15_01605 [Sphingomonas daechungensis]